MAKQTLTPEQKERKRGYSRRWRKSNPEKTRKNALKHMRKKRGFPEPSRPCPNICECCGGPPNKPALALDHCHKTGVFRGWLCARCNVGIGMLGDSVEGLDVAIKYLKRANVVEQRMLNGKAK